MDSETQPILIAPPGFFAEEVTWVHHWTESLFSFKCTRDPTLRFTSGQFAMIGLMAVSYTHLDVYKRQPAYGAAADLGRKQLSHECSPCCLLYTSRCV